MRFLPVVFALSLVACQSCKKPDPPPHPPTPLHTDASTQEDASVAMSDAGLAQDAAVEASSPPPSPCASALAGAAYAFCDVPGDVLLSASATAPASKSKLTVIKSEAVAKTRFAVRHSNGAKVKMKTVVVLTNAGKAPGSFTVLRKGVSGPSSNALELERLASERWSSSTVKVVLPVAVGKTVRFDASVEVGLPEGYATMGLYEYSFDQPHTVTVCFLGEREDWSSCPTL